MARKGIKQASKKSQYDAKVSQLDSLGQSQDLFDTTLNSIEVAVGQFVERVLVNIQNQDMNVTGKVSDIEVKTEDNSVVVYANPWLTYQDMGVNGSQNKLYNTPFSYKDKKPPVDVFKSWINTKNIQLRDNSKYYGKESPFKELTEEEQVEKVAWAISSKIYKQGFKPRNVYSKEIPELLEDLGEIIGDAITEQIGVRLDVKSK